MSGRLAVVGGHGILGSTFALDAPLVDVDTKRGPVAVRDAGDYLVLQRHGVEHYVPPHRIDHVAHATALQQLGCDRILALSSVGSLRLEHPVGAVLAPDDFIALAHQPLSMFDDVRAHTVPGFDADWRTRVVSVWSGATNGALRDGGVYWQTTGPRFETAAEVRFIAQFADVVGMTVGSECVVAGELGLAYAAVCIVDNLANGLGERPLTMEEFETGKAANRERLLEVLARIVPELAR